MAHFWNTYSFVLLKFCDFEPKRREWKNTILFSPVRFLDGIQKNATWIGFYSVFIIMFIGVFASYKSLVWIERCVDLIVSMHSFGISCMFSEPVCYISVVAKLVETFLLSNPLHSTRLRNEYLHLLPSCDNFKSKCASFGYNKQKTWGDDNI